MSRQTRAACATLLCGLTLAVTGCEDEARTAIPQARVVRAATPPVIDGRLDEDAWGQAQRTERFVHTMDGSVAEPRVTARLLWDDDYLYLGFEVDDPYLSCTFAADARDAHLWEQDAVELMIDPDGDGRDYFELQLSPTELVFDTWFSSRRQPAPVGHSDWSSGLRGKVTVRGTVNDDATDQGYVAELAVPFEGLRGAVPSVQAPHGGDTWRLALYVLDARREGQLGVGWSAPLVGDFHVPDRFGRITFAP